MVKWQMQCFDRSFVCLQARNFFFATDCENQLISLITQVFFTCIDLARNVAVPTLIC